MSQFTYEEGSLTGLASLKKVKRDDQYLGEIKQADGIYKFYYNPGQSITQINHDLESKTLEDLKEQIESKYGN